MKRVGGAGVVAMWALSIGTAVPALADPVPGLNPSGEQAAQIQIRLQKDPSLQNNRIVVTVDNGIATLKGTVDSPAEKSVATRLASVGGIVGIDNRLQVGGASLEQSVADDALTARVKEGLVASQSGHFDHVSVATRNGVVTLTGSVANEKALKQVLEIAHGADGVAGVENNLTIAPTPQP
ncbi:MAG TPA: BON domain-containing protein [Polyangia bacterium]|jgi:osmotically-inducible protein OsmY|nr:BON domain-containing protein [Polyangia bacterium]